MSPTILFLGQALVLVSLPFALWSLPPVRRNLPLVVVQVLVGVLLGPSLFGRVAPELKAELLPPDSLQRLEGLSLLAVLLFVFQAGLHLDPGELRRQGRAFFGTALSSMLVPCLMGALLGLWALEALPQAPGEKADPAAFVVGVGLCIGVTALPVLAAILRETGLIHQEVGRFALGCAALNDILLWVAMAGLLAFAASPDAGLSALLGTIAAAVTYVAVMAYGLRPLLAYLLRDAEGRLADGRIALMAAVLAGSALATELLGLHYLIGAFAAGAVMPKRLAAEIAPRLETVTVVMLLPFFFILTGLKVSLDLGEGAGLALFVGATLVAAGGKVLGTAIPARLSGRPWPEALQLGALMQCKGLMEVVILTVLLDAELISQTVFSALLLMAIATTAATLPMARLFARETGAAKRGRT